MSQGGWLFEATYPEGGIYTILIPGDSEEDARANLQRLAREGFALGKWIEEVKYEPPQDDLFYPNPNASE